MMKFLSAATLALGLASAAMAQDGAGAATGSTPSAGTSSTPSETTPDNANGAANAAEANPTGSSNQKKSTDGQWTGSCVEQSNSGAPTATQGTTDGSGTTINNC